MVNTGSSLTAAGTVSVTGLGDLQLNSDVTIANLVLDGGTVSGSRNLTITGQLVWSAGTMRGTGWTIINSTGVVIVDGGATKELSGRLFSNYGAFESGTPSTFRQVRVSNGRTESYYDRTDGADGLASRATNAMQTYVGTLTLERQNSTDSNAVTLASRENGFDAEYQTRVDRLANQYEQAVEQTEGLYDWAQGFAAGLYGPGTQGYDDFMLDANGARYDAISAAATRFTQREQLAYNDYSYALKNASDAYNQVVSTAKQEYAQALRTAPGQGGLIGDINRWAVYMHDLLRGNVTTPPPLPPDRLNANFPATPAGFLSGLSSNARDALAVAYYRRWGVELSDDINATLWGGPFGSRSDVLAALFRAPVTGFVADVSGMLTSANNWLTDTITTIQQRAADLPNAVSDFAQNTWTSIAQTANEGVQMLRNDPLQFIATAGEVWVNSLTVQGNTLTFGLIPGLNARAESLVTSNGFYRAIQVAAVLQREVAIGVLTGGSGVVAGAGARGLSLVARLAAPAAGRLANGLLMRVGGQALANAAIRASGAVVCRATSIYRAAQPYFLYQQVSGIVDNVAKANAAIREGDYETAAALLAQTAVTTPHAWASARDSLRLLNALGTMNPQTISNFLAACFAEGTPIIGEHGSKPIEGYQVGERVWSRNENDPAAPPQLREIEAIFVTDAPLWHLHIGGQVIRTTAAHPFWLVGKGWTAARALTAGDRLIGLDGKATAVDEVCETGEWAPVYNFRVAEDHTYFVGCPEWGFEVWSHNVCEALRRAQRQAQAMVNAGIPGADKLLTDLNTATYRSGYIFQARRAYLFFRRGRLQAIEVPTTGGPRPPRVDIQLSGNQFVETKSWQNFNQPWFTPTRQRNMLNQLDQEVRAYLAVPGSRLRVEFNGTMPDAARQRLQELKAVFGDRLTWRTI